MAGREQESEEEEIWIYNKETAWRDIQKVVRTIFGSHMYHMIIYAPVFQILKLVLLHMCSICCKAAYGAHMHQILTLPHWKYNHI